jgi:2-methylcitrate dehydratase
MPLRATRAGQLSMWKGAATAAAVRSSLFSVQMAQLGMTGPEAPFSGRHGLTEQISGPIELPAFGTRLADFLLPRAKLKYWPVAYNMQPAVWAAIALREQVAVEDLESIDVETYWQAWSESGSEPAKWDPRTRGTADHSLPYIMARTLRHGAIDPDAFEPDAYLDPTIRPLMRKISVRVAEDIQQGFPDTIHMRTTGRDRAGRLYGAEIVNPLGHESNPISRDGISEKFARLCEPVLGAERTSCALSCWFDVDRSANIAEGMDLLDIFASSSMHEPFR